MRVRPQKIFCILILSASIWLVTERSAMAYLDPGTGSMLLQMLLGGIAAFFFAIKLYWKKLVGFFKPQKEAPKPGAEDRSTDPPQPPAAGPR